MSRQHPIASVGALALLLIVNAGVAAAGPPTSSGPAGAVPRLQSVREMARTVHGAESPLLARKLQRGYLVPDAAGYDATKRALDAGAAATGRRGPSRGGPSPRIPTVGVNFPGPVDSQSAPSDSTGAVGTTRYIELVNRKYRIFNRSGGPIATGSLGALVGDPTGNVFDPQVIWDAQTNRFYYVTDNIHGNHFLMVGFSKTASPNSAADFCKYQVDYGPSQFPDYPKLGDTRHFLLIGSNVFDTSDFFIRSDIFWLTKPAAGPTCPPAANFLSGGAFGLKKSNGTTSVFTPVPAQQIDAAAAGYSVSRDLAVPSNSLTIHKITRNANGTANIPLTGKNLVVPTYQIPSNVVQSGNSFVLDSLDTRPTQAVSALNPARANTVSLWTQQTIAAGGGSQVRWYEINPAPAAPTIRQSGNVTFPGGYAFNGAISPDRQVNGATARFGANMVIAYNTSSSSSATRIRVRSKLGAGAISGPVTIVTAPGPMTGFDCVDDNVCRWGDYAAATPDPVVAGPATRGRVWITSQYNSANPSTTQANWLTRNASVVP